MGIKKRKSVPVASESESDGKLVIVAQPKKPLPKTSKLHDVYGDNATGAEKRRLGNVALSCGEPTADARLTATDRIELMRSPLDKNNPQEARYRNRVRNRGTAITAMCITCVGGRKAVTECVDTMCPLWAFRFGGDPFYGKSKK